MDRPADFEYQAGQFVQICIPQLSLVEFHPLTLSSAPHESKLTLHVRALGDWSRRLVQLAAKNKSATIHVGLEGPYGSCAVDLNDDKRYKFVLLVSGGIGVTPCQSIGKDLLYQHIHKIRRPLKHLRMVWAVRDLQMVHDIPPLEGAAVDQKSNGRPSSSLDFTRVDNDVVEVIDSSNTDSNGSPCTQVDIYCTRTNKRDPEDASLANDADGAPYRVHYGRPDLDAIFQEIKEAALAAGESNVAVIGCGPMPLMKDLRECCLVHSSSIVGCQEGIFFDLHTETFEF